MIRALKKGFADLPFGRTAQTPDKQEGYVVPESYSSSLCQYMYSALNGNNAAVIRALKKSFADLPFGRTGSEENTTEGHAVPEHTQMQNYMLEILIIDGAYSAQSSGMS